ncbi:MAG: hypothetical protein AAFO91_13470, partial [Bacteroidota bacterium]
IVGAALHVLFFILAYEFWFDDGKTSTRHPMHTFYALALAGVAVALAYAYVYVFSGIFFSYPYALLILVGSVLFFAVVILTHKARLGVLLRTLGFALAMLPVSLVYEYVIIKNELRFLANSNEYIAVVPVMDIVVPLEELVLILVLPFCIAVLYELYLDNAK